MQLSAFLTIDRESVLAGKLLWKLFQTYFTGMAKSVALDLTNQAARELSVAL